MRFGRSMVVVGGGSELLWQWVVWVLGFSLGLGLGIGFCLGIGIEFELLGGGGGGRSCDLVDRQWLRVVAMGG